jgi:hypothetical protein
LKSLGHLAQETGVPNSSAQTGTEHNQLKPFKTITTTQLHYWSQSLKMYRQPVHNGESDPRLLLFSDNVLIQSETEVTPQNILKLLIIKQHTNTKSFYDTVWVHRIT